MTKKIPARALWMHARCAYIHELLSEGDSLAEIARTLSCDPGQVQLLGMTDPESILEPWSAPRVNLAELASDLETVRNSLPKQNRMGLPSPRAALDRIEAALGLKG